MDGEAPGEGGLKPIAAFLAGGGDDTTWVLAEPGRFEIDRFDRSEVAGRFSLVARPMAAVPDDTERHVQVTARFAFRCATGVHCDPD